MERMTKQEIEALRERGWRVYDSESVNYDFLMAREVNGKTVTRRVRLLRAISTHVSLRARRLAGAAT